MSKEWYVASVSAPEINPEKGIRHYQGWTPCVEWCKAQFGMTGWRFVGEGVFEFCDEKDYTWFMLRWG